MKRFILNGIEIKSQYLLSHDYGQDVLDKKSHEHFFKCPQCGVSIHVYLAGHESYLISMQRRINSYITQHVNVNCEEEVMRQALE